MEILFKNILVLGYWLFNLGGIIKKFDLDGFTVSLLYSNQRDIILSSLFMFFVRSSKFGLEVIKHVSSAKSLGIQLFI